MASKARGPPPPLPPRQASDHAFTPWSEAPPPYEPNMPMGTSSNGPWSVEDPRTSSTQSLVPSESNEQNERRRLLLIYIHGFMGNETSFRSFPAHVHNLLTVLLAETHVVHTKVYPRYRSKRNISFARDDFSKWLEPNEDPKTDVVFLGHSMGGLLSAEVALMPAPVPANRPLKHTILGTINFDVPFLGMHPGVIKSGLASIFQPSDNAAGDKLPPELQTAFTNDSASSVGNALSPVSSLGGRSDPLWEPEQPDPNFNPTFANDVILPMRKGWQNAWHWFNKHSDHLYESTKNLVSSHLEFGGAMANYSELKTRYSRIRVLAEENEELRKSVVEGSQAPARVRFVNYYTASTGRVKKTKSPLRRLSPSANASQASLNPASIDDFTRGRTGHDDGSVDAKRSRSPSPRISLEEHSDHGIMNKEPDIPSSGDEDWNEAAETLTIDDPEDHGTLRSVDPMPVEDDDHEIVSPVPVHDDGGDDDEILSPTSTMSNVPSLPPIPEPPARPSAPDVSNIQDPKVRKLVEKEHARAVKAYEKAVKDREKAIRDRAKLEEKRERKIQADAEKAKRKAEKDAQKGKQKVDTPKEMTHSEREELRLKQERERMEAEARRMRGEKEHEEETTPSISPVARTESIQSDTPTPLKRHPSSSNSYISQQSAPTPRPDEKPNAPKKDRMFCMLPPKDGNGERDPLWVRIFMENVDEVGAHCGLFFLDERYERLVGEVADRIEHWVKEDADARLIRSLEDDSAGNAQGSDSVDGAGGAERTEEEVDWDLD